MYFTEITIKQVLTLHQKAISSYGGDKSIIDIKKLESALNFLYLDTHSVPEIAGKIAFRICINHPFVDGNKRTAFLAANLFLKQNGYQYNASQKDAYYLIMGIASSKISEEDCMAHYLKNSYKKN